MYWIHKTFKKNQDAEKSHLTELVSSTNHDIN